MSCGHPSITQEGTLSPSLLQQMKSLLLPAHQQQKPGGDRTHVLFMVSCNLFPSAIAESISSQAQCCKALHTAAALMRTQVPIGRAPAQSPLLQFQAHHIIIMTNADVVLQRPGRA
jgi:hypothetical protein